MFAQLAFNGGTMMCIPCFAGSATDAYEKGAFLGMSMGTTHQQMLQSVVEGVTHEMTVLVDRLAGLSETPIDTLRAFGGPTKSAKWLQLKADISGKKIEAVQVEEASALGAALLAGVASGVYNSYEQAIEATLKIKAIYQPRPEIHKIYQRQHHVYQQLTGALSPVNKALFDM
jgi:xylulokinase